MALEGYENNEYVDGFDEEQSDLAEEKNIEEKETESEEHGLVPVDAEIVPVDVEIIEDVDYPCEEENNNEEEPPYRCCRFCGQATVMTDEELKELGSPVEIEKAVARNCNCSGATAMRRQEANEKFRLTVHEEVKAFAEEHGFTEVTVKDASGNKGVLKTITNNSGWQIDTSLREISKD